MELRQVRSAGVAAIWRRNDRENLGLLWFGVEPGVTLGVVLIGRNRVRGGWIWMGLGVAAEHFLGGVNRDGGGLLGFPGRAMLLVPVGQLDAASGSEVFGAWSDLHEPEFFHVHE